MLQASSIGEVAAVSGAARACRTGSSEVAPAETRPRKPRRVALFMALLRSNCCTRSASNGNNQTAKHVRKRAALRQGPAFCLAGPMMSHAVAAARGPCNPGMFQEPKNSIRERFMRATFFATEQNQNEKPNGQQCLASMIELKPLNVSGDFEGRDN